MACIDCGRGLHDTCDYDNCDACHGEQVKIQAVGAAVGTIEAPKKAVGRPLKPDDEVTDVMSTGRKRAALEFPIPPGMECEWKGKKKCGGGKFPIIGCINGMAEARHHGPDKFPLNNEVGNVHRICSFCHNRWHALNDPHYVREEYAELKTTPEPATQKELLDNESWWNTNPAARRALAKLQSNGKISD